MAPLIDSKFTNPDELRTLYRNPRNTLKNLDDADAFAVNNLASVFQLPIGSSTQTDSGGLGPHCPAVGQFTMVRGVEQSLKPVAVQLLRVDYHYIWHPITGAFQKVTHVDIVRDQDCVIVRTMDEAESIVSITDVLIQTLEDVTGKQIFDLINEPDVSQQAVSCINFKPLQSEIAEIVTCGKRDVVSVSLEGNGIYASGTTPTKMTVRHNKPRESGGGDGGPV